MISRAEWEEAGRIIVAYNARCRLTGEKFLSGVAPKPAIGLKTNIMAKRQVTKKEITDWMNYCYPDFIITKKQAKHYLEWEGTKS